MSRAATHMRIAAVCFALGVAGCDDVACPLVAYSDSLTLQFTRDEWAPARYTFRLDYEWKGRTRSSTCDVHVPALLEVDADGGVYADAYADGGSDGPSNPMHFRCGDWQGDLGRGIMLWLSSMPDTVQLTVEQQGVGTVVERRLRPDYQSWYPDGPECGGYSAASFNIRLP